MSYNNYATEDFVIDPFFIQWVKEPDDVTEVFWQNWLKENPDKKETLEEAREIVLFLQFKVQRHTTQDFIDVKVGIGKQIEEPTFASNTHSNNLESVHDNETSKSRFLFSPYLKVAASFLILAFFTALYFIFFSANQHTKHLTKSGELKTIVLPDNSEVVLNSNSSIEFSEDWSDSETREVWLRGEAFFSVVKKTNSTSGSKKRIKFIVHTSNLDVEVLGTKFNIDNKAEHTKVVLNSGKIKLRVQMNDQEKNIYMKPGELVEFSKKQNLLSKRAVEPEMYSSWQDKDLVFEEQSLTEIAEVLESQMGLKIIIEDPALANLKFTGTSPRNNLDILFTSIAHSFDAEIKKKNKTTIIIKSKATMN